MKQWFDSLAATLRSNTALKVSIIYALFSVLWILFSDQLLFFLVKDSETLTTFQMLKGWFFVITTAAIIFILLKREISRLRETENILWATLHATADGILVVSNEGKILATSNRFSAMWGLDPRHLATIKDSAALRSLILSRVEDADNFLRRVEDLYSRSEEVLEEIRLKDGRVFERHSTPLVANGGEIGRVWSFRDLTRRKRAEEEKTVLENRLLQAQKLEAIGTLAGGIAHDFNNILAAVSGYTELALGTIEDQDPLRNYLDEVMKGSHRAKELVQQVLRAGRIGALELRPLKPQTVIHEALRLLRSSIPTTIDIETDIAPHCPAVMADATQLHQVVMNICTNAYHAMRESGGKLTISLAPVFLTREDIAGSPVLRPGPHVQLSIRDTGPGIPADRLNRIFEPYYTTKATGEGTGLGLAVVHGIVTRFGGEISVDSAPGGTAFNILLPESPIQTEAGHETGPSEPLPGGHERILLVDDDRAIAAIGRKALENLGYRVTAVTDSLEALAMFEKDPEAFDLMITDMTMPRMTGAELSEKILNRRPDLPIILCTGYSDLITEEKAGQIGIRKYFMKPVAQKVIARAARQLLDERCLN